MLQTAIESELDKRGGKSFGPPGGKLMTIFMDDFNMPEKNSWNDQPTLEFIRQLIETSGFCFLDKDKRGDLKNIEDLQYIAAMGHPSSGRQDIPNRLKRHFFIFNKIISHFTKSIFKSKYINIIIIINHINKIIVFFYSCKTHLLF
jgi:dynein heavy chain